MIRPLDAVKQGIPVNRADEHYCVPRSTFRDRETGNVEHGIYKAWAFTISYKC